MPKKTPSIIPLSFESVLNAFILSSIGIVLAFLPDEKLIRAKLQGLEILLLVWLAIGGWQLIQNKNIFSNFKNWRKNSVDYILLSVLAAWVGFNFLHWFISDHPGFAHQELRRVLLVSASFFIARFAIIKRDHLIKALWVWSCSGVVICIYAILQKTGGLGPIQVPQMDRVFGTFGNPIFFAAYILVLISASLFLLFESKSKAVKTLLFFIFLLNLAVLYLAQTRAAFIGLGFILIGIPWVMGFKFDAKKLAGVGCILFLAVLIFGKSIWMRDQGHLLIWRDTVQMIKENPITGVGIGTFHIHFPDYAMEDLKSKWPSNKFIVNYAHNEYLQMAAESGLVGFGLFFIFWILYFFRLVGSSMWTKRDPLVFVGLSIPLALLVQNFFSVDFRFSVSAIILFLVSGFSLHQVFVDENRQQKEEIVITKPLLWAQLGWVGLLAFVIFPWVRTPYRATEFVQNQVDFFDDKSVYMQDQIQNLEKSLENDSAKLSELEQLAFLKAKNIRNTDGSINQKAAIECIQIYEQIIQSFPDHKGANNNLGNIYYTIGNTNQAISYWNRVVEIDPDFLDVHLNLGKVYYVQGKLSLSAHHFNEVLRLSPNHPEAIVYLKRMVE